MGVYFILPRRANASWWVKSNYRLTIFHTHSHATCHLVSDRVEWLEPGDIAQLARAPALQAGGPEFESLYLHQDSIWMQSIFYLGLTICKGHAHLVWGEPGFGLDHSTKFYGMRALSSVG